MHIRRSPAEIARNRARYEEHQQKGLSFAPKALPAPSPLPAPPIPPERLLHQEEIPGGWYWATRVKRHETLRITLDHGHSCVAMAAWNAADPSERLNLPDTVKLQWTTGLGKGRVIFSDMGRVMFSITEDSCGAHDCLAGLSTAASNERAYRPDPNTRLRNGHDNLIIIAEKLGFSRRDLPAVLSLFAPVRVDEDGRFHWRPELLHGADYVELRAEMDLIAAFSNCPHPLDPNPEYTAHPVTLSRLAAAEPADGDLCRTATAEAIRGFGNNASAI